MPHVELLWWKGCPSHPQALDDLRAAMVDAGLPADDVMTREVTDQEAAERERFVGSPTIRVDGRDVQPPPAGEPPALTCRVYRLRDGRPSPTPARADLDDALRAAVQARAPA